jgi:tRNA A-37 threonylcarbamoyl transferase component Bud32
MLRPIAADVDGSRPALAFEGKRGELLEAVLASHIERSCALQIALRLAQLVAGLHEARVIHRDPLLNPGSETATAASR